MAHEAVDVAHVCGSDQYLGWAHTACCVISLQQGDLPAAIASGERAVQAVGDLVGSPMAGLAGCSLAWAQLESGLPDQCSERMLKAGGGPDMHSVQKGTTLYWYEVLTQAELELGNIDGADEWASRLEQSSVGLNSERTHALRARSMVLVAQGDPAAAAELALESVAAAEALRRSDRCRALTLPGRCRVAGGRPAQRRDRATRAGPARADRMRRDALRRSGRARAAHARQARAAAGTAPGTTPRCRRANRSRDGTVEAGGDRQDQPPDSGRVVHQ